MTYFLKKYFIYFLIFRIKKDMDFETNKLTTNGGQHCTIEMINLLLHGRAVSNYFNDSIFLSNKDNFEQKGPNKRNEIGFLSFSEHYKKIQVGSYYKTPRYPIWIISIGQNFSVVFGLKRELVSDWKAESRFDLHYFDGQDEQIKITICN
jgi:hypothetical protein